MIVISSSSGAHASIRTCSTAINLLNATSPPTSRKNFPSHETNSLQSPTFSAPIIPKVSPASAPSRPLKFSPNSPHQPASKNSKTGGHPYNSTPNPSPPSHPLSAKSSAARKPRSY